MRPCPHEFREQVALDGVVIAVFCIECESEVPSAAIEAPAPLLDLGWAEDVTHK